MNQALGFKFTYINKYRKEVTFHAGLIVPDSVNAYDFAAQWFYNQYPGARLTRVRFQDEDEKQGATRWRQTGQ